VKETFLELEEAAREIGLKIHEEKTKVVVQSRYRGEGIGSDLTIGDYSFKVVQDSFILVQWSQAIMTNE
jgi:hypothetical protein